MLEHHGSALERDKRVRPYSAVQGPVVREGAESRAPSLVVFVVARQEARGRVDSPVVVHVHLNVESKGFSHRPDRTARGLTLAVAIGVPTEEKNVRGDNERRAAASSS